MPFPENVTECNSDKEKDGFRLPSPELSVNRAIKWQTIFFKHISTKLVLYALYAFPKMRILCTQAQCLEKKTWRNPVCVINKTETELGFQIMEGFMSSSISWTSFTKCLIYIYYIYVGTENKYISSVFQARRKEVQFHFIDLIPNILLHMTRVEFWTNKSSFNFPDWSSWTEKFLYFSGRVPDIILILQNSEPC